MEVSEYGDCLMNTRLLTKLTVVSKVGVSSVSSISESVSVIPWICLAFAKFLRSLLGRKRQSLIKWALEGFAYLQRRQKRLCCYPGWGGWASELRLWWGWAKVRNDHLASSLLGCLLEERWGPEIFQALRKPVFELSWSDLCHTVVSQVEAETGSSIKAMSEHWGSPLLGTFLHPRQGSHICE